MSAAENKAIFLSYASQDAEAAKRICDALRAAGVEVWFDQSELVGGDAWDQKIRKQIKECALLIPIISANTQSRTEGYFRLEWRLADQRTHLMAKGRPFLLPVVIDDTRDADAHVPDSFTEVQWTRLRGGETPVALAERVRKLLSASETGGGALRPDGSEESGRKAPPTAKQPSRRWLAPVIAGGVIALLALVLARPWGKALITADPAKPAALPLTDAQKLVAQARSVYEGGDALNRENLYFAEEFVKRAQALDPTEPTAWEFGARLSYQMVWFSIENTEKRRELLVQQADRALALAPQSVPARLAVINARLAGNFNRKSAAEGFEREIEDLAAREPGNWRVQNALATTYRILNQPEKSLASMRRALELSGGNPEVAADLINLLLRLHLYPEAEEVTAVNLSAHASARLMVFDAFFKLRWRGDVAAAKKSTATFPAWLLQEDRGLFMAWQIGMWGREPERAQRAAQGAPRDYVRGFAFYGPRAVLTAQAHEMAGNAEAARADWQIVLDRVERELVDEPENEAALYWKAWALARLGQMAEARSIAARVQQLRQNSLSAFAKSTDLAPLLVTVGQTDAALADIKARMGAIDDSLGLTRATLELDPAYDPIRPDPRFQELVRLAQAPEKPKTEDRGQKAAPPADDKSVAVLAFANLSDDKANEYFSDGISEELLNVLTKVPGLKVTARTSSFYFKGKEVTVPEIARQLGVAYVVEGSVRKSGDKVRITAQLIKAADGFHVWSDTFTRELKDVFAVQDEIAGLIARNLSVTMGVAAARPATVNAEAYPHLFQARFYSRQDNNEGWQRSVQECQAALALDPDFALAAAEMARSYIQLARFGGIKAEEGYRLARGPAEHALAVDPNLAEAHNAVGWVRRTADWDWAGADAAFRRAYELAPRNATMIGDYAIIRANQGYFAEARELAVRALELDPMNASARGHYALFLTWGEPRLDEATSQLQRAMALSPAAVEWHTYLSRILVMQGRLDEAAKVAELEPSERYRLVARGLVLAARSDRPGMERAIRELVEKYPDAMDYYIAEVYGYAGDNDRAFEWMERARQQRDTALCWILGTPAYKKISLDPRWPEFLKKLGHALPVPSS